MCICWWRWELSQAIKSEKNLRNHVGQFSFKVCLTALDQGWANDSQQDKSRTPHSLAFVNQILLKHSHARLYTVSLWLLLPYNSRVEWLWVTSHQPKIFTIWPLAEKFANLYFWILRGGWHSCGQKAVAEMHLFNWWVHVMQVI